MSNFEDNKFDSFIKRNLEVPEKPSNEWVNIQSKISKDIIRDSFWFKSKVYFSAVAASILFAVVTVQDPVQTEDEVGLLFEMAQFEAPDSLPTFDFDEE